MTYDAAFYDKAMTERDAPSMRPLHKSPWRPMYAEAASWIQPGWPIIDLGCGTGRFARELSLNLDRHATYAGWDFSPAAINEARRYADQEGILGDNYLFGVANLDTWAPDRMELAGNTAFTILEVLEHLNDDLVLIRRIPPGHRLIFSVPNYDSESHVRQFENVGDVWERYSPLVTFNRWSRIDMGNGRVIHLCDTTRRSEAW